MSVLVAPKVPELTANVSPARPHSAPGDHPGEHHHAISANPAVAGQIAVGCRGPHGLAQPRVANQTRGRASITTTLRPMMPICTTVSSIEPSLTSWPWLSV